jgi:hypothetical protein
MIIPGVNDVIIPPMEGICFILPLLDEWVVLGRRTIAFLP